MRSLSTRGWILVGLVLALALGIGGATWSAARRAAVGRAAGEVRAAILHLGAATDLVRAAPDDDVLREVVARFAAGAGESVRVFRSEGVELVASTVAGDAAPRRLRRDEKPLADQAQRLRTTVESNRDERAALKEEIEVERSPDGRLIAAGPLERDGAVVGLVEVATRPTTLPLRAAWGVGVVWLLGTVLLFAMLTIVLGGRRWANVAVAAVLLVAALVGVRGQALTALERGREEAERSVARRIDEIGTLARSIAADLVPDAAGNLDPLGWDVDVFRHARGIHGVAGIDQNAIRRAVGDERGVYTRIVIVTGIASMALLLFVGLSFALRTWQAFRRHRAAYYYAIPSLLAMALLVFIPFLYGVALSFTDANIYNSDKHGVFSLPQIWIGLDNFTSILFDFAPLRWVEGSLVPQFHNFYWTLLFTVLWTVSNVSIGVSVGLVLALILHIKGFRMRPIYRVLLILPWAMPNYITALIWKGMFHQQFGVVNQVLQMLGARAVSWFDTWYTSFMAVLATNGWLSFPFMMVVALGALQSIPSALYEAARVDGASRWQQFRFITLPSLRPAMVPAIILSVIWTFNQFNVIYLVSQGEPGGATEILITESYKIAFEQYRYGYAAAYSVVIFVILLAYGRWQNRVTRATEGI